MDYGQPSKTIGPGRPPNQPSRRRRDRARRGAAATGVLAVAAAGAVLAALFTGSCSDGLIVPAAPGSRLEPGVTYSADLDRDDRAELVLLEEVRGSLTLTDGDVVYRSRDKWRVLEAHLGDIDQDGFPEVVALLDADDGRHVGLFAYFGGEYRERFVSSALVPRPVSLSLGTADAAEDVVVVAEEPGTGRPHTGVVYRWNGFGFTIQNQSID